ncbi:MAG TPA: iron-sulfur cluster assembly scaffold protein [Candidatus Paceibacterota bacterium]
MDSLYQEHILEHYRHPHNRGRMEDCDVKQKGTNISCGDDLVLYLKWGVDGKLSKIMFEGFGCAISQSGASMLTDKVKGMTKKAIAALAQKDMYELYGTEISPQREKCALLALNTLKEAIGA